MVEKKGCFIVINVYVIRVFQPQQNLQNRAVETKPETQSRIW